MSACAQCGTSNPPGAEFCRNPACGAYLGWDQTEPRLDSGSFPIAGPGRLPDDRRAGPRPPVDPPKYGVRLQPVGEPQSDPLQVGGERRIEVRVVNTGTLVDEFILSVAAPVRWIRVEPTSVSVYPAADEPVAVVVSPPERPAAVAGPVPYRLLVRSSIHPHVNATVDGHAVVAPVDAVTAEIAPVIVTSRGAAESRVLVSNDGNRPVLVELDRADRETGVHARVAPATLELGPGRSAEAAVRLRPRRRRWFGQPARHPYRVRVAPRPGEPLLLDAAFVQQSLLPRWVPRVALLVIPALAVAAVLVARTGGAPGIPGPAASGGAVLSGPSAPSPSATGPSTAAPTSGGPTTGGPTTGGPTTGEPPTTRPSAPKLALPVLRGVAVAAALTKLRALGLQVEQTGEVSNQVPAGHVLGTEPPAGTRVDAEARIRVLVSKGPTPRYDLLAAADRATWRSGAGPLPFDGNVGDPRGFVLVRRPAQLQDGSAQPAALETHPEWVDDGYVEGDFTLPAAILPADHLMARVGILAGSSVGQVRFSVFAVADNGTATPLTPVVANGISQPSQALDVDLSRAAGARTVRLRVDADGSSAQDWAAWVEPQVIGRP